MHDRLSLALPANVYAAVANLGIAQACGRADCAELNIRSVKQVFGGLAAVFKL